MGCAPSALDSKEQDLPSYIEIKVPAKPITLLQGFNKSNRFSNKLRTVPWLSTVEESRILTRRRMVLKKGSSMPELFENKKNESAFEEQFYANSIDR